MGTLRDDLLPVIDDLRQIPDDLGLRRYRVLLRSRAWPGGKPGIGKPVDTDTEIVPAPKVRLLSTKEVAESGGTYRAGDFKVEKITPAYAPALDNGRKGWAPGQLVQEPQGAGNDVLLVLVGDEGPLECTVVEYHFDRPFNYWLVARKREQVGG